MRGSFFVFQNCCHPFTLRTSNTVSAANRSTVNNDISLSPQEVCLTGGARDSVGTAATPVPTSAWVAAAAVAAWACLSRSAAASNAAAVFARVAKDGSTAALVAVEEEEEEEEKEVAEGLVPLSVSHGAGVYVPVATPVAVEALAAVAAAVVAAAAALGDIEASTERLAVDGDTCATRSELVAAGSSGTTKGAGIDNWTRENTRATLNQRNMTTISKDGCLQCYARMLPDRA